MKSKLWLVYAIVTTLFWGVWGAFTGLPPSYGFPETLIYCVWESVGGGQAGEGSPNPPKQCGDNCVYKPEFGFH